ncbi:PHD finger protein 21A-like [Xenia sp. Carnegie-2017]|uniref:PHD finger protein 21A-like n=1 Tax=Xenia sp. Carnegie-2017 TaxID=2897299 RepID=UPI001F039402|nr:PHD finger protein 21A-like [Xenia sp. Carnegie-2017]
MDLEKIQEQLKSHIRQHQIWVNEMKKDPQNVEIQRKVQSLQAELTNLNEKQKQVVQLLKKNIQPNATTPLNGQEQNDHPKKGHSEQAVRMNGSPIVTQTTASATHELTSSSTHNPSNTALRHQFTSGPMERNSLPNLQHSKTAVSVPKTTNHHSTSTYNNVNYLKNDRSCIKKPNMVTTGIQTVSSNNLGNNVLRRPEARKISQGIQTTTSNGESRSPLKQNTEKLNFLSTLGLITVSKCREINSQKNERRRRTSAIFSPYSSFQFFDEPKRTSNGIKRGRGRASKNSDNSLKSPMLPSPVFVPINGFKSPKEEPENQTTENTEDLLQDGEHEDHCAVCQQSGEVLMCDTCILVYHLKCLTPPLTSIPTGMWMCPKCREIMRSKEPMEWPGTLAVAHSYLKHRAEKDKEKQKLLNRNQELKLEELELQRKVTELSSAIVTQIQKKTEIVESTRQAQEKLQRLKRFIQIVHSSERPFVY